MRLVKLLIIPLLLAVFQMAAAATPNGTMAKVASIQSADSFAVENGTTIERVKLADIDSPSSITPEGAMAKRFAEAVLKGRSVLLNTKGRNSLGQLLCVVYLVGSDGRPVYPCFNRMLVDSGHGTLTNSTPVDWWQKVVVTDDAPKESAEKHNEYEYCDGQWCSDSPRGLPHPQTPMGPIGGTVEYVDPHDKEASMTLP